MEDPNFDKKRTVNVFLDEHDAGIYSKCGEIWIEIPSHSLTVN